MPLLMCVCLAVLTVSLCTRWPSHDESVASTLMESSSAKIMQVDHANVKHYHVHSDVRATHISRYLSQS